MKELSIEGKATRYDKAVESLRAAFYDDNNRMCEEYRNAALKIIEPIFPELKESEGEKIMGKIIATIHLYYGEPLEDEAKEMIAWLEKQGEQKPAEWSEEDEKILSDIIKDLVHPWNEYIPDRIEDEIKWLKNRLKSLKDRAQPQTKQEWSEEDKKMMSDIIVFVSGYATKEVNKEWVDFLKSLKDRVQPKQEWSEKDEKIKEGLINSLAIISANTRTDSTSINYTFSREIDWLKSLRPQNHWKPSDEQMDILKLSTYCKNEQMSKVLLELYQDLKKLRVE